MATPRSFTDEHVPHTPFASALNGFVPERKLDEEPTPALTLVQTAPPPQTPPSPKPQPQAPQPDAPKPLAHVAKPTHKPKATVVAPVPAPVAKPRLQKGNIPVWELFSPVQSELFDRIKEHHRQGVTPIFAFFFEEEDVVTHLALCAGIFGKAVHLKVVDGEGKLVLRFPVGTIFSVDELRGLEIIADPARQQLVNEFRRVMDILRGQLYYALSRKLSEALRKSGK